MSRRCLRERARVKRERKPRLLSKRQAPATSHPAPSRATNPCSPAASKPVACCQRRPWRFLWFHPHALVCCATAVSSRKPRAGPDDMAMPPQCHELCLKSFRLNQLHVIWGAAASKVK